MNYSILVVDDDDDFILLATHLRQCHQNVNLTYAPNGVEATKQLLAGLEPNIIIVDSQMPMMDGYELLNWLMDSDAWRHIPIVIWTGSVSPGEVTRYYRAGANSVMLKQDAMQEVENFCHHWFKLVQLPHLTLDHPR